MNDSSINKLITENEILGWICKYHFINFTDKKASDLIDIINKNVQQKYGYRYMVVDANVKTKNFPHRKHEINFKIVVYEMLGGRNDWTISDTYRIQNVFNPKFIPMTRDIH